MAAVCSRWAAVLCDLDPEFQRLPGTPTGIFGNEGWEIPPLALCCLARGPPTGLTVKVAGIATSGGDFSALAAKGAASSSDCSGHQSLIQISALKTRPFN